MPANLEVIAGRLCAVLGRDRPAAIISRATTPFQRVIRAPLGRIASVAREARIEPPSTLVVGDVVNVLAPVVSATADLATVNAGG